MRTEIGFLQKTQSENLGLSFNAEPNISISEKGVVGLGFGITLNPQKFENNNSTQFNFDEANDNAVISFIPIFDYYFNNQLGLLLRGG